MLQGDARNAMSVMNRLLEANDGKKADDHQPREHPGTEMASILSAREGGIVYFFSMATS